MIQEARIRSNQPLCADTFRMELICDSSEVQPGQF